MKTTKQFNLSHYCNPFKVLFGIATVVLMLTSCGKSKNTELNPRIPSKPTTMMGNDTIWVNVEEMPEFPGGDTALLKYIGENTIYPDIAKKNNIQGKVILRFCISSKGNVNAVSILKGINPALDAEAIRVINTLPSFIPGRQGGKPVAVWYMVPITFALK